MLLRPDGSLEVANFDVESYKGYKSKFNDIYREEAYALLNVIIEMLG